jgi:uncharacterized protein (DUF1800 family)
MNNKKIFNKAMMETTKTKTKKRWQVGLIAAMLLVACGSQSVWAKELTEPQRILHVLDRLGYGPRPGDMEMVQRMGVERYIQSQLTPEAIPEAPDLLTRQDRLETLKLNPKQLFNLYGPPQAFTGVAPAESEVQTALNHARIIVKQAEVRRLMLALESRRQLQEVMTDFWFNHFNVYRDKNLGYLWVGSYEQAIRANALGRFRDLLGVTAHHPAMLVYLDNWKSTAQGQPDAKGRVPGLNENYARELMELHTLGVDGGYSQDDVIALARILTGWGVSVPNPPNLSDYNGPGRAFDDGKGFYFNPKLHDFGSKTLLNQPFSANDSGGLAEGERALDLLASHPATANYLSYKLAQYFVADEPPKPLVNAMAKTYLQSNGDIRAVLNTLFHSNEFWSEQYVNNKFKTPYVYLISSLRATGLKVTIYPEALSRLNMWGMPLYSYLTPDGYKNTEIAWRSPDALLRRLSFASDIGHDKIPFNTDLLQHRKPPQYQPPKTLPGSNSAPPNGTPNPSGSNTTSAMPKTGPQTGWINPYALRMMYDSELSEKTQNLLNTQPPEQWAMTILGNPAFMYR